MTLWLWQFLWYARESLQVVGITLKESHIWKPSYVKGNTLCYNFLHKPHEVAEPELGVTLGRRTLLFLNVTSRTN